MQGKKDFKCALLFLGALFLITALAAGCTRRTMRGKQSVDPGNIPRQNAETVIEGIVIKNDTATGQLTMKELDGDVETVVAYDATAQNIDRYGSERDGEDIGEGEIIEATCDAYRGLIISSLVPKNVWEYQEVKNYDIDIDEQSVEFAQRKYQYTDATYFGSGGRSIELMELNKKDILTVRGIGYTVYSVVRTEGHGYIRLKNYEDFIGGMIEIGNSQILSVTKNMLITVRAGSYKVIISRGKTTASQNVTVRTDEEITIDFKNHKPVDDQIGTITFDIEPAGADLTINGTAVKYNRPIALAYGVYQIEASMTGYTTYTGRLDVEDDSTVRISLVEEEASAQKSTPSPSKKTKSTSSKQTKKMDSDHTITVSAPEGAEVYLDNVYKGLAPCTFTKIIGTQTITLSKAGYTTKSYTVDILNDGEDVKLSFADLAEASGVSTETEDTAASPQASTSP